MGLLNDRSHILSTAVRGFGKTSTDRVAISESIVASTFYRWIIRLWLVQDEENVVTQLETIEPLTRQRHMEAPTSLWGILLRLGPGLILVGNIVGSGELIATPALSAVAGYTFLWLIVFSCFIKVFFQIEIGRYAISEGRTTLESFDLLPGPRLGVNWVLWYWVLMMLATLVQIGGMCGGVAQALRIALPIWSSSDQTNDTVWAILTGASIILLLLVGKYKFIERVSLFFVTVFTLITLYSVVHLQFTDYAATASDIRDGFTFKLPDRPQRLKTLEFGSLDVDGNGLLNEQELTAGDGSWNSEQFRIADTDASGELSIDEFSSSTAASKASTAGLIALALMAFGITGVGASELVAYPYWCLEKGYGRFVGEKTGDDSWANRARNWIRVMQYDAWLSMVVFTIATIAFYLLGAALLHRDYLATGNVPEGTAMVERLSRMYLVTFGKYSKYIFLLGAFCVLYSTFFIATAANARMLTDWFCVMGIFQRDDHEKRRLGIAILCIVFPIFSTTAYLYLESPVRMVMISGVMQAFMLPIIGVAVMYFAYKKTDRRLRGSRIWYVLLWISFVLMAGTSVYGGYKVVYDTMESGENRAIFQSLDADRDGKLTLEEFRGNREGDRWELMFTGSDATGDGLLSEKEFKELPLRLRQRMKSVTETSNTTTGTN